MLALLGTGCFGTHGPGGDVDAGPVGPGPVLCDLLPASIISVECEAVVSPDGRVLVTIESAPSMCCDAGTPRTRVASRGRAHSIEVEWDACDCCETCRCFGPIQSVEVELGPLFPGTHSVDVHGSTCTIEVPEPASCVLAPGELLAPEHILMDQPYAVTITSEGGGGCGCTPRVIGADVLSYALELCDCCEVCDCIDPGYQASHVRPPLPPGEHIVDGPDGPVAVTVHSPLECNEIVATAIRVYRPRLDLVQGSPSLTWVFVEGTEEICCEPPVPVVARLDTTGPGIALSLQSCADETLCICSETTLVSTGAWFNLGELPSGEHIVRAGGAVTSIVVP